MILNRLGTERRVVELLVDVLDAWVVVLSLLKVWIIKLVHIDFKNVVFITLFRSLLRLSPARNYALVDDLL